MSTTELLAAYDAQLRMEAEVADADKGYSYTGGSLVARGKVISGMLFLIFVAGLRFVVPWQRITGFFETYIPKLALSRD